MTLSAIGDAETPAGGSVCMRCMKVVLAKHESRANMSSWRIGMDSLQYVEAEELLGHGTLKSRMRRLRAGVVIFRLELRLGASLERMEDC